MHNPTEHLGYKSTHPDEWREGTTCDDCRQYISNKRRSTVSRDFAGVWFGTVPGGASPNAWRPAWEKQFKGDMESYREAVRNGLEPQMVSKQAVEKAEQEAEVHERFNTAVARGDVVVEKQEVQVG